MLSDSEAIQQRLDHLETMIRSESDQRVSDTLALNERIKALSNRIESVLNLVQGGSGRISDLRKQGRINDAEQWPK